MEEVNKVNIEDYIELYNKGLTLDRIKPPTQPSNRQTYWILRESKTPVRIVNRTLVYENSKAFEKIKYFVKDNPYFYMIPVRTIKNTIVGFILRGVTQSSYSTVSRSFNNKEQQVPLMFGFDSSFVDYEKHDKCWPIIVCEGCKDCLALKQFYPYVLANNTSSMGLNSVILRNISDRFLLAYDNDTAGEEGMEKDKEQLRSMGAIVETLQIPIGRKDCADVSEYPEEFLKLKEQIMAKLKKLYKARLYN